MKRFLGLAVLILGMSVPAHAQFSKGGSVAGASSTAGVGPNGGGGYGGGGIGGGGDTGVTNFHVLPVIPPANLPSIAVSGSNDSFEPSSFLPYKQAIAAGQDILNAQHESVAEAAAENSRTPKSKAKALIIEDAVGDPVIAKP